MVKIREAIVVEGKYDKNTLSQIVDAPILATAGFGIMKDKAQLSVLRRVAEKRGLIIFTDSDGAGFVIRNYLKGAIDPRFLKHAYIPDVYGKEKRKAAPSKEGKLGVEGIPLALLKKALEECGVTACEPAGSGITKADLYELGLSGRPDSAGKRKQLLLELELPERLSANALVDVLNKRMSKEELARLVARLSDREK